MKWNFDVRISAFSPNALGYVIHNYTPISDAAFKPATQQVRDPLLGEGKFSGNGERFRGARSAHLGAFFFFFFSARKAFFS